MTFTATAQTRSSGSWMRRMLLTAGFALLLASTPQLTADEDKDPMAATSQIQACEAMGGEAAIDTH